MISHKKLIEYNDVVNYLTKKFPEFQINKDEIDLPYMIAGDFSDYLVACHKDKSFTELERGLDFIEILHVIGTTKVKELATIGFLEAIQNSWKDKEVDPEIIFDKLGKESQKCWIQLNKFWQGDVRCLNQNTDKINH